VEFAVDAFFLQSLLEILIFDGTEMCPVKKLLAHSGRLTLLLNIDLLNGCDSM